MANEVLVGLVGFSGVVVGAAIQFLASSANERWKHTRAVRTDAYRLLLKSIAGLIHARRSNDGASERLHMQMLAEAKALIALYGSRQVMTATAVFFREHAIIDSEDSARAFTDIAVAMRKDSYANDYDGFRKDYNDLLLIGAQ